MLPSLSFSLQPSGSLADRLSAIASAASLARRQDAGLIVVWASSGAPDFGATWADLFESPALPVGPFPGGHYTKHGAGCKVHHIHSHDDFVRVHSEWEQVNGGEALCITAAGSFVRQPHDVEWFFRLLAPSEAVMAIVKPFTEHYQWERWGQWIGIHVCRSEECRAAAVKRGRPLPKVGDYAAMAWQLTDMPLDGESVPRFFISSEDGTEDVALQEEIWGMNLTGAKGTKAPGSW